MRIGFSTGSIAQGNVEEGLKVATHPQTNAVEISALREDELDPLLRSLDQLRNELRKFSYISFHAPSKRVRMSEADLVDKLKPVAKLGWAIIVHPDVMQDLSLWRALGAAVCIENMDKRKSIGQTTNQLRHIFEQLPDATFCFDIGHASQVDPTMQEADSMLEAFRDRLRQVHMSYVNSTSHHERLNYECIQAYRRVAHLLAESVPVILETPVQSHEVEEELSSALKVFAGIKRSSNGRKLDPSSPLRHDARPEFNVSIRTT